MKLNKYGLPVLDPPTSQRKKPRHSCPFNFQGNKAMAFIAVQAFRNETRRHELIEEQRKREDEKAKATGLW